MKEIATKLYMLKKKKKVFQEDDTGFAVNSNFPWNTQLAFPEEVLNLTNFIGSNSRWKVKLQLNFRFLRKL